MKIIPFTALLVLTLGLIPLTSQAAQPLRALLISGGCCHDYGNQGKKLKAGIEARANVKVDVVYSRDRNTKVRFAEYEKADWAKGYDTVIHDECSADVKDKAYVKRILDAHRVKGVGAVNLHCAMHSYRVGNDDWFEFVGVQSTGHGPQKPIAINFVNTKHPITTGLKNWTTINEELYNSLRIFDTAQPLAKGTQTIRAEKVEATVAWVNHYGNARVFSTTIGHNTRTVADDRYLDLITRGLLWSCDKLTAKGEPANGYGPAK